MLQRSLFEPAKEEGSSSVDDDNLRDYQRHRVDQIRSLFTGFRSTLLVMHCGAGKTKTAGTIVKHWPGKVLWCAHRDFLCNQARKELSAITKEYVDLEKANWHAGDSRIVVASVQTLQGERLKRKPRDMFSLIVMDESHHATSKSWRAIPEHFEGAKVLYLTATPKRADGTGMHNIVEAHADPFGIENGLRWGSFVPVVPISEFIDDIDLSSIPTRAGDLALNEVEAQVVKSAASIAQLTVKHMENYPTIIYTPGVASAHAVAATLREMGKTAAAMDADTDIELRTSILNDFRDGKIQYIANCAILTEGLDVPNARGIVMARPTKSESLYIQCAGRGGRPCDGDIGKLPSASERIAAIASSAKPNFKLLDCTGHAGRHSLCSGVDLLGGKRLPDVIKAVKEKIAKGEGGDRTLDELLDEAEKTIREQEEESRKKIAQAAMAAEVRSRQSTFDPLVKLGFDDRHHGEEPPNAAQPASPGDIQWLKDNRLPTKNVTRGMVSKLREQAAKWRRDGMASWRHRHVLARHHCPVDVPFEVAGEIVAHIKASNWQPDMRVVERIVQNGRKGNAVPSDLDEIPW